ncbi:MAG: (2Fe-2S)-binding protein [Kofleriaceae bacterium]|nr:(2Fe-2S)-binding protein [Kofleriaceae bacterium]
MSETTTTTDAPAPVVPPNTVTMTVDGKSVTVAKGTNVLEAAKQIGVDISAFCYHPGLSIAACCRQCLVSVEKNPKLQPSCQTIAMDGMVVRTEDKQSVAARKQMLEFTLVNHPIDCPICDKAGECTLQKLYVEDDNANSRVDTVKVHKEKALDIGPHIILDQERCILCTRCIRVCDEVAGVHQLDMSMRGDHEVLGTAPGEKLDNPYSLNTVDACPVGALTAKDFRFTMRAWELEMTPSICQGCSTGCNIEVHHKDDRIWRIVPRHNEAVNKYWMCDDGRFTYHGVREARLAVPTVDGLPSSWDRAVKLASEKITGLRRDAVSLGVVLSAVHNNEDNYAVAKLAKSLGVSTVYLGANPAQPDRADDKLRDADVNANVAGANAIAAALGLTLKSGAEFDAALTSGVVKGAIVLGDALALSAAGETRFAAIPTVVFSAHERGPVKHASVALPLAAWAEASGTVTNRQGLTQRMHAAVVPAGQAVAGWDAVSRVATALGVAMSWSHVRDANKEMIGAVSAFAGFIWVRDARPVQLRFAASRG